MSADARELAAEEMIAALDWIDGELHGDAALDFELRLANDSVFARCVEQLALLDEQLRREARVRARIESTRRRWNIGMGLAAAAVLAICLLPQLFSHSAPSFEVALAPGYALAEDWVAEQAELIGASAPGIATLRGGAAKQRSAAEFLRASELAELAVSVHALEDQRRDLESGWFVLPLELDAPAAVLVLACDDAGHVTRLFPSATDSAQASREAQRPAGRQMLPSPRAISGREDGTLSYSPGFLVPLGAGSLQILVAVYAEPLTPSWMEHLDSALAAHIGPASIEQRLVREGFKVQRLSVREPR
jgi:hypothetical protein